MNYIMLPENFQSRPRPGHRNVKKVSQTFSPMSRTGRRVQGEAKATATVADNAKKEDRAKEFMKFVKTLNKVAGQRRVARSGKVVKGDSAPRPTRTSDRIQRLTAWLARSADAASSGSRMSSKREAAKSATEPIWRRAVRRVKVKIAMSSTVNIPRPQNAVNQIQVVVADTIQNQFPVDQHPVHGVMTPGVFHNVMAHQDLRFPVHEIHNHDYLELERTAVACAYMGMDQDEPMDLSPDFPSRVANDDDRDLERTAIACAYAAIDEPMDTTLDDTQGPMAYDVHQNIPPVVGFVGNPQERQFDHAVTFQQPVYETLRPPGHEHLIDQDYRLWPPPYAHIDNQIFPQPYQERFVNENLPPRHYHQVGHYPQGEDYLDLLPGLGYNARTQPVVQRVFYDQDILGVNNIQQQAEIHHHHIGHGVHLHPGVLEERIVVPEHDAGGNWNGGGGWQYAIEERQHDYPGFFVDVFGENAEEREEPNRLTAEGHILDGIEDLFGDSGKEDGDSDDDNDEESELQIIL